MYNIMNLRAVCTCPGVLHRIHFLLSTPPAHPARPLLGVTGSRSPASFQLGNIAAQFKEEEEEGSEDSPTEEEEVRNHSCCRVLDHVLVCCHKRPAHICTYTRTYRCFCMSVRWCLCGSSAWLPQQNVQSPVYLTSLVLK